MTTKLTITFALTTALASPAFAADEKDGDGFDDKEFLAVDKLELVDDPKLEQEIWGTEFAKTLVEAVKYDGPIIDEVDPGPRCDDIQARYDFFMPVKRVEYHNLGFNLGIAGDASLIADSTKLAAEASFGPGVRILGNAYKAIDARLTAATLANQGGNTIDLSLYAFGYQIDTYNITSSQNPIDYLDIWGWALPNVLTHSASGSYDCGILGVSCTLDLTASSTVAANVGVLWGLNVDSSTGVRGGLYAATYAHAGIALSARAHGDAFGEDFDVRVGAGGHINLAHAVFSGLAKLVPYNSYWLASAEYNVAVEDILGVDVGLHIEDVGDIDIFKHQAEHFDDSWKYSCTFDRKFK